MILNVAGAEILKVIRAQSVIVESGQRADDLFDMVKHLVGFPDANDYLAAVQSGLGIRYSIPGDHQLLGRRVPDADISSPTGATRIYELLNTAHTVLLDFPSTPELRAAAADWASRIDVIRAQSTSDTWSIPGLGKIPVPAAVLIRPDGYVAWMDSGDHDPAGLQEALTTWCGPGVHA